APTGLSGSFRDPYSGRTVTYHIRNTRFGLSCSTVAGALSGLLGIGGGVIQVPLMASVMGVPIRAAAATSSYMIGLTASASLAVYLAAGFFDPLAVGPVSGGALFGAYVGSLLQKRVAND